MKTYLSVIIPAFNEEDNFKRGSLSLVVDYLKEQHYSWEIILVNDGSTDGTLELLQKFVAKNKNVKLINNPHMGKAATVISGALAAEGEVVLFSDMDQATPIGELEKLLPQFEKGFDLVIGSRANREGAPMFRQILAYSNVFLRALILGLPFKDTQCGFKAFSSSAAKKIFTIMHKLNPPQVITGPAVNPGFDVELLYIGRKLGYKISEIPVSWRYQESRRVSFAKDALAGLHGLLIVRYRSLTSKYGF